MEKFYKRIIPLLDLPKDEFARQKIALCRELGMKHIPANTEIIAHIGKQKKFRGKPVRTISGVAPIAIMTKPWNCPHGRCTFCPGGIKSPFGDVPQSYTGHEPATMRAMRNHYDAYLQVMNRLQQYHLLGHDHDKAEVIIMGGTFPAMDKEYQEEFVMNTFKAMNDFQIIKDFNEFFEVFDEGKERYERIQNKLREMKGTSTLEKEHECNETAKVRCIGLTIETKPDWGMLEHGNQMLKLGCTRVELGIQSVYDDVLAHTHRGHTVADTKKSSQVLKDLGFKINAHYMPDLPLTDKKRDLEGMKQLFSDPDYRPDMLKIYPCMVSKNTPLWRDWKEGEFTPLSTEEASALIKAFKPSVPEYCRIMRVQRDVPTKWWEAGVGITNLRQHMHNQKVECRCIRCREPKDKPVENPELIAREYKASGGKEFFISFEDKKQDVIAGFIRMRFPKEFLRKEITPTSAIIRELHVYGTAAAIGDEGKVQHKGLGKQLLAKAEDLAKKAGKDKMVVIAGIGVKEYYQKLGYEKEGPYVVKSVL